MSLKLLKMESDKCIRQKRESTESKAEGKSQKERVGFGNTSMGLPTKFLCIEMCTVSPQGDVVGGL